MIYIHWIGIIIYVALIVASIVAVLMDNRQPVKTMAWLMVLLFMPPVGIVLFFFFGKNTRKERLISQRQMDELTKRSMIGFVEQSDLDIPHDQRPLIQLFANQSMALPFKDNDVDILTSGYDFFPALLREIGRARHHIHILTYIIEDDPLGRLIADALIDKARQGVEVRLIYDDVGCWRVSDRFFARLRRGGVDVRAFMPVRFPAFTGKVNYRNHRKLCVVDGRTGFVGGMNIALRYVKGDHGRPWRDTHLRIVGGGVATLQQAFLVDWYFVSRQLLSASSYYRQPHHGVRNHCLMQLVMSSPVQPWLNIMQGYVRILLQARHYVYLETPYFLPTEPVLFALRTAALAGVDVRVMLPSRSDARVVRWAERSYVVETMQAGVKMLFYAEGFNHSKFLVSDDSVATVGSTNVDFRSFENNFEANAFFFDRNLARRLRGVFEADEQRCVGIEQMKHTVDRSFPARLLESLMRLISPVL